MCEEDVTKKIIIDNIYSNLNLLRFIYVISYNLGYFRIAEIFPYDIPSWSQQDVIISFAAVVMFLLSIRLYWAVGNIRRYFIEKVNTTETNDLKWPFRQMMFLHVPILMAHSFTFFLLSRYLVHISWHLEKSTSDGAPFLEFLAMYCGIIGINAFWLYTLKTKGKNSTPERFWMLNNTGFALGGFVWIVIGWRLVSIDKISGELFFIIGLAIFLVNTFVDFWNTYEAYTTDQSG